MIPWDPYESNAEIENYPSPPTLQNLLERTSRQGHCLKINYGLRYSLAFSFIVWILTYLIGTLLGALMGFFGGWTDLVGQRIMEIFEATPFLLMMIYVGFHF